MVTRKQKNMSSGTVKVEFKDMDFFYAGAKEPSLSQISFQALKGQTIGIIGGTGSGNLLSKFNSKVL